MNTLLILTALALAPGLAIIVYIYTADRYNKEPKRILFLNFIGGMFSVAPAIFLSDFFEEQGLMHGATTLSTLLYAFITVALSEEFSKFIIFKKLGFESVYFDEPFDGIIYAVMVAMGFATLENLMYVFQYGIQTAFVRMFTAVPAHATFGVMMGYFAGKAKFNRFPKLLNGLGLSIAVLFHGAYDFFLLEKNLEGIYIGAFISLYIALQLSKKAIKSHQVASPFK